MLQFDFALDFSPPCRARPAHSACLRQAFSRDSRACLQPISAFRSRSAPLFRALYNTYYNRGAESHWFEAMAGRRCRSLRARLWLVQDGPPFPFRCVQHPETCFVGISAWTHRSRRLRDTQRGPCWPHCARPSHPGRPPAGGRRSPPQWAIRCRNARPPAG